MKIFKISQTENDNACIYTEAVVIAKDAETARRIDPYDGNLFEQDESDLFGFKRCSHWCSCAASVTVEYHGEAKSGSSQGVVCARYSEG